MVYVFLPDIMVAFLCLSYSRKHPCCRNRDEISKEKPSVKEIAAAEVTVENSDGAPLDKSSGEASNSERSLAPPSEDYLNIEMRMPLLEKRRGTIHSREGHGDDKQNLLDTCT